MDTKLGVKVSNVRARGIEAHNELAGDIGRRVSPQQKREYDKLGVGEPFLGERLSEIVFAEIRERSACSIRLGYAAQRSNSATDRERNERAKQRFIEWCILICAHVGNAATTEPNDQRRDGRKHDREGFRTRTFRKGEYASQQA